jgi:dTDP-4-amino-4,6-dideoxygalactose transaminase
LARGRFDAVVIPDNYAKEGGGADIAVLDDSLLRMTAAKLTFDGGLTWTGWMPVGAAFNGRRAGSIGLTGCWSFFPFKILGCYGDGGAISTNDPEVARKATLLRYNGEDRETREYHYHGFTCLLDNLQAAFLGVKLRHLPDWIARRRTVAEAYHRGLGDLDGLVLPHYTAPGFQDVYQNYVIRTKRRDALNDYLEENGVETLVHWRRPYYSYKALGLENRGYPETEAICRESISLPMNVEMSDDQVDHVTGCVRAFWRK